jgi:hypothetical protein
MKKTLLILLLLAACGRDDPEAGNRAAPAGPAAPAANGGSRPEPAKASATRLAGLYEGGSGAQKNQMCVVEKGKEAQFGLLVWGGNLSSCSGAGRAVRSGERLTLTMTGDETCTIDATVRDGKVALPDKLLLRSPGELRRGQLHPRRGGREEGDGHSRRPALRVRKFSPAFAGEGTTRRVVEGPSRPGRPPSMRLRRSPSLRNRGGGLLDVDVNVNYLGRHAQPRAPFGLRHARIRR